MDRSRDYQSGKFLRGESALVGQRLAGIELKLKLNIMGGHICVMSGGSKDGLVFKEFGKFS